MTQSNPITKIVVICAALIAVLIIIFLYTKIGTTAVEKQSETVKKGQEHVDRAREAVDKYQKNIDKTARQLGK